MKRYFLDTYAMIELIEGGENYRRFIGSKFYTSIFNLYELNYTLLRLYDDEIAARYFNRFKKNIIGFTDKNIFDASMFKHKYKKRKLSYADCIGYIVAKDNGMKFFTGDKEFEDLDNVEFVKK